MTKEQLLFPRYQVSKEGYPKMPFGSNQMIILDGKDKLTGKYFAFVGTMGKWYESYFDRFPSIFRKMEWWEERKKEDMPKYIKHTIYNEIGKVEKWDTIGGSDKNIGGLVKRYYWCTPSIQPATEEEYNAFMQKKK